LDHVYKKFWTKYFGMLGVDLMDRKCRTINNFFFRKRIYKRFNIILNNSYMLYKVYFIYLYKLLILLFLK
jgi:hypothetical protein